MLASSTRFAGGVERMLNVPRFGSMTFRREEETEHAITQPLEISIMKANKISVLAASLACVLAVATTSSPVGAAQGSGADIDCKMDYSITGWSIIYKHSSGTGTVRCNNGQTMNVKIKAKGVGLTAGKWRIDNGNGRFSDVHDISQVLGRYAHAEAHAGVVKSGSAQLLSKGTVSLALAGKGEGVDLGVDVGQFTISRRR